jgi:hypothetical protein
MLTRSCCKAWRLSAASHLEPQVFRCPQQSCEPRLHILEGCHLNGVDRLVDDTILSVQIRTVEGVALVDRLRCRTSLVETVRRNGSLAPRIACRVLSRERQARAGRKGHEYVRRPLTKNSLSTLTFQPWYMSFASAADGDGSEENFCGNMLTHCL